MLILWLRISGIQQAIDANKNIQSKIHHRHFISKTFDRQ